MRPRTSDSATLARSKAKSTPGMVAVLRAESQGVRIRGSGVRGGASGTEKRNPYKSPRGLKSGPKPSIYISKCLNIQKLILNQHAKMDRDGVFARRVSCPRATERRPLKANQTLREFRRPKESGRTRSELPAGNSVRFTMDRRATPRASHMRRPQPAQDIFGMTRRVVKSDHEKMPLPTVTGTTSPKRTDFGLLPS
jgi:hypothetical protein